MKTKWILLIAWIIAIITINTSCQKQTDYSPQINSLQTALLNLQKRSDSLATALSKTNSNLLITNTNVSNLNTLITSIQTQVASILSQISTLNSQLSSTNANVSTINGKITDLNSQLNSLLLQMNTLLAQQSVINSLQNSLTKLQNRCDSVVNALAITNRNLQTTNNSLVSLQNQVITISGQIATLNSQLASTNINVSSILSQITELSDQYTSLTTQINHILIKLGMLPSSLKSGLVAWYPFSGNANDESGNSNHGTVIGATLSNDRFGNLTKAYNFDGTTSKIEVNDNSTLKFALINKMSISLWFKMLPPFVGNGALFISKQLGVGDTQQGFNCGLLSVDLNVSFIVNNGTTGVQSLSRTPSSQFTDNSWHHCVFTFDNGVNKIYLDNSIKTTLTTNGSIIGDNTQKLLIGTGNLGNVHYFMGQLDDIGIWNHVLTPQEVTLLSIPN